MLRTACFFIALILATALQAQQLPLETYTPANGLVDARITKMFQDSKGRIYFLTREGFSIFDGQRFENYGAAANSKAEIFNDVTEYNNGTVKLFSFDGNIYSIVNNKVSIDSTKKKLLSETNKVLDIGNNERLIITNYFLLKEKDNQLLKLDIGFAGYLGIENAAVVAPYLVFSAAQNPAYPKVYLYNYQTQQLADSLETERLCHIVADKKNNIYFFSSKWLQFDAAALAKGKLKTARLSFEKLIPAGFSFFNIQFDNDNTTWLSNNEKGYCQLVPASNTIKYFYVTQGILRGTNFVYQDIEKNYWFISSGSGVQKLQRSPLTAVTSIDNTALNYVAGISNNENKDAYINAYGGIFLANKKISSTGLPNSTSFYWQNQYWSFTDYKTLTGSKGIVLHLEQSTENYLPLDFQSSYSTIDKLGRLIIAGKTVLLINKDYSIAAYKLPYFCDNIIPSDNNSFWCFLRSNYVVRLSLQNNKFIPTYTGYFPNLDPRYSIEWSSNNFIVGTRLQGLVFLQWKDNNLKITGGINKRKGLSNDFINVLLKKGENRLLAGTGTGLDMLTFTNKDTIIENLSARNSIFSSFNNLIPLKDSAVLCRTLDGQLFKLENADTLSSNFKPVIFFKKIMVNSDTINFTTQKVFGYNSNNFNFSVSAPSFLDNRNTRFHFSLSGNNRQWEQANTNADFQINNLLPGTYQLTVTVQYPGKFYNDLQLQYNFTVNPPFWKQWWFILIAALLAFTVIFYSVRLYFKRHLGKQKAVLEKELAIEQERTRMSRELHDGLGSMLSGIKHSFSAIKNQLELNEQQQTKFNSNIDHLNESIKELRNISHSMASESLLKYGLENSLKDYCQNISTPGAINISFTALHAEKMQLTEEQTFHIFRIVQELLQNVIKHAPATNAIVQISYNAKRLYITVEDDGNGFDMETAKKKNGMGLKNIETRVKLLKGKIDFQTSSGTSVLIEVPCAEKTTA